MRRLAIAMFLAVAGAALAQQAGIVNNLRGPTPLGEEAKPAPLPKPVNDDQRRARSYPAQPPVIPHQVDNYQVDLRFNKCMDCHGRSRTGESQAPMVSVTHYQDRDGQLRQEISPRRYFCTGCHVPQADVRPPVKNTFQDFYDVRADTPPPKKGAKK
ncbi:MAG TPA: nitrate reductase cytochrome c-type subunit [Usitatibacter sp.]|nr:nitrate reductase cytochrome c-type subunit [Usitatibacter sp.]